MALDIMTRVRLQVETEKVESKMSVAAASVKEEAIKQDNPAPSSEDAIHPPINRLKILRNGFAD